ncbi:hypothetical protein [Salegentibacter chungangensis]|uniref:Uncharacterized protein n=1 Tax=Salegentibacter chungangensis TaxID=1335724 RepID=A0ABW3NM74_9FLAO
MKTVNEVFGEQSRSIFSILLAIAFVSIFLSCSVDSDSAVDPETIDLKAQKHLDSWEDQVARLDQKMRRFENIQVAMAQGWSEDVSGYVPQMGHHYLNPDLADGTFEVEKPEALLYVPTEDGGWEFVAVEYLIFGIGPDGPAPEGFIGEADVWVYNSDVPAWTLHAWVGLENPDGVFAAFNPLLP